MTMNTLRSEINKILREEVKALINTDQSITKDKEMTTTQKRRTRVTMTPERFAKCVELYKSGTTACLHIARHIGMTDGGLHNWMPKIRNTAAKELQFEKEATAARPAPEPIRTESFRSPQASTVRDLARELERANVKIELLMEMLENERNKNR